MRSIEPGMSASGVLVVAYPSRRGLSAAPKDEVETNGSKSDPHGEEARCAVSNHEGPDADIY